MNKKAKQYLIIGLVFFLATSSLYSGNISKNQICDTVLSKDTPKTLTKISIQDSINTYYNYRNAKESYQLTFLEFGMTFCFACKKMKIVMLEIDSIYSKRVKVVFYNVNNDLGKVYADHYNITLIPVQILLDKNGEEFYRHEGFLSTKDLSLIIEKSLK